MPSVDFRERFLWLVKASLVALFILGAAYGIVAVGSIAMARAKQARCEGNLRRIGEALLMYKRLNKNYLPPYLTALYPDYIADEEILICPADRHRGTEGAFPRWTRYTKDGREQPDWREEFAFTDLDGPTLVPWDHADKNGNRIEGDKDTFPCSYYYRFNEYPADVSNLVDAVTWQQHMEEVVREYGDRTPIVTCLWHLPEYAKDTDGDTINLLYGLTQTARYPKDWRLKKTGNSNAQ